MKLFVTFCLIVTFGLFVGLFVGYVFDDNKIETNVIITDQEFANKEITKEQYEFVLKMIKKYPEIHPIVRHALDKDKKITNNSYYVILQALKKILDREEKKDKHEIDI
jgi:hypothetical protein